MIKVLTFCRKCSETLEEEKHLSDALRLVVEAGKYAVSKDETLIVPHDVCDKCKSPPKKTMNQN